MIMTEQHLQQKLKLYYDIINTQQTDPVTLYLQGLVPTGRRSVKSLLKTATAIINFEGKLEEMPWNMIEYQHLSTIRNTLQERKRSANTINLTLSALKGVMKACFNLGIISADQLMRLNDIKRVRGKRLPSGRSLTKQEIKNLYRVCTQDISPAGKRDLAIIATMLATGIRRSEVITINIEDYNTRNGLLNIQSGKGNKQRTAYLNTDSRKILKKWLIKRGKQDGALFNPITKTSSIQNRQLSSQAIYGIIRQRTEQAQVGNCRPHDLRRTFVTQLLEAGIDINTTRQLAGHTDIQTTARYDLRDEKSQKKALKQLHDS
jgi:site-specific recombinase XerD